MTSNETRRLKAAAEFVSKAKSIHGDRYNYELVEYTNSKSKVKIICKEHGIFEQPPTNHLSGNGCPVCSAIKRGSSKLNKASSSFISTSNIIHNDCYDYSLVDYQGAHFKIKIICKKHGVYEQAPTNHLKGHGCPLCARDAHIGSGWTRSLFAEKCEKNNNGLGILYIIECFNDNERFYKIGITSRSTLLRYNSSTKMPYLYSIVKEVIGDPVEIYNLETKLHQINKENKYIPSIPFGGHANECFSEYKEK